METWDAAPLQAVLGDGSRFVEFGNEDGIQNTGLLLQVDRLCEVGAAVAQVAKLLSNVLDAGSQMLRDRSAECWMICG
jgi:hypothetical protein